MEATGCTHAILEVSDKSLSQTRIAGVRFDSVCVTHITDAHLDWYTSIQNYRDVREKGI